MVTSLAAMMALMVGPVVALGATYHVSPKGNDSGPGSKDRPWRTPHRAAERAKAGDTVIFRGGTYELDRTVGISTKGRPHAWLVWQAAEGERPIFDFAKARPERAGGDEGAIDLRAAEYVRLRGLEVRNSHYAGIFLQRGCRFIDLIENKVDLTFRPGIGAWNSEDVRIVGNEVTRANDPRMRLFGDPRHECPHEAISVAGVNRFEVAWNHVHSSVKEGIDVKEISRHGVVHHNYVHHMDRQAYYVDAWFGLLEDVEFVSNIGHDSEWGLAISSEGRQSELKNVRIRHNVFFDNRASGIYFGTWGGDGPRSGILIEANTLIANGRTGHWAGATGNIDVRSKAPRDLTIRRNVMAQGGAYQMAIFLHPERDEAMFEAHGIRAVDNLFDGRFEDADEPSPYGQVFPWYGDQPKFQEARFVDRGTKDFRLADAAIDAGAFARGARTLPTVRSPLKGFPAYQPRRTDFPAFVRRAWWGSR